MHALLLPTNFKRVLVIARAQIDGLTQLTVGGPLAEFHLDDYARLDPVSLLV
ncbi:MAG: hypothetical protein ABIW94_05075 [Gemmatimonadaceae bacterium]